MEEKRPGDSSPGNGDGEGGYPRKVWVDTARTANKGKRRKPHVAYDGKKTVKIKSLTELAGHEVYVDSLFPEVLDEVSELLRRGVRVYALRDLSLIKKTRDRLGLKKNDENDARALSAIPLEAFKELKIEGIELRQLVAEYELLLGTGRKLRQMSSNYESLKLLHADANKIRHKSEKLSKVIQEKARKVLPFYQLVEERLGLKGPLIVELLLHVDFSRSVLSIKSYILRNRKVKGILSRYISSLRMRANKKRRKETTFENEFQKMAAEAPSLKEAVKKTWPKIIKSIRRLFIECNGGLSTPGQA